MIDSLDIFNKMPGNEEGSLEGYVFQAFNKCKWIYLFGSFLLHLKFLYVFFLKQIFLQSGWINL